MGGFVLRWEDPRGPIDQSTNILFPYTYFFSHVFPEGSTYQRRREVTYFFRVSSCGLRIFASSEVRMFQDMRVYTLQPLLLMIFNWNIGSEGESLCDIGSFDTRVCVRDIERRAHHDESTTVWCCGSTGTVWVIYPVVCGGPSLSPWMPDIFKFWIVYGPNWPDIWWRRQIYWPRSVDPPRSPENL
jgi:hypothetical protein